MSAEVTYDGRVYRFIIGVNPTNNEVLVSLFIDRKPVCENVVAVAGEGIIRQHNIDGFFGIIKSDFAFFSMMDGYVHGNKVMYADLIGKIALCRIGE